MNQLQPHIETMREELALLKSPVDFDRIPRLEIPPATPEQLKDLVFGILGGTVFTHRGLESYLLGLVFIPIALGALRIPPEALDLIGPKPDKPVEPEAPQLNLPKEPEGTPKALEAWRARCQVILVKHAKERKTWDNDLIEYQDLLEEWNALDAEHEARHHLIAGAYLADLGLIYEYLNKAGRRGFNGYPCFTSARMLNQKDWQRVYAAVAKEQVRREILEV